MKSKFLCFAVIPAVILISSNGPLLAGQRTKSKSHPPTRPLPTASARPLAPSPAYFVDPKTGADANNGSKQQPWKTLAHAVKQLKHGDTLYLRGGSYYEHVTVACSGTAQQPITIRSYPGEIATIDGGLREFFEQPAQSWEPCRGGAVGEYRSTKKYPDLGGRPDETNLLGNFGDSMIPLHGYRYIRDLKTDNMFFKPNIRKSTTEGTYCGPGLFYDTKSGHIHVRLAHTHLKGLGDDNYKGETDPRKIPLVVAGFKGGSPLVIRGAKHLVFQDIVVCGSREPTIDIDDCENLTFDGLTVYAGSTAFRVMDTWGLRVLNTACRGIAAPWTFRGSLKYRAIEARIFSASSWMVSAKGNRDFELAYSEFTDSVDGVFIGNVRGVKFHHNLVDNISDDAIFLTATTAFDGTSPGGGHLIFQNHLSRCLTMFAFGAGHGRQKALPDGRQTGAGAHIFRNVFDFRRPVMYYQPSGPDAKQELDSKGRLAGDHGGPTWEPMWIYHNTILDDQQRGYAYGALGLGDHMGRGAKRRVFNNIVVQLDRPVSLYLPPATEDFQADGNLLWSMKAGKTVTGNSATRKKFLAIVEASKKSYPPGWTARDRFANPEFVKFNADWRKPIDLALSNNSAAINAGVELPKKWPDPLRAKDNGKPDQGALPFGAHPWQVGVRGRLTMFGQPAKAGMKLAANPFAKHPIVNRWRGKPAAIIKGYPAFDAPLLHHALERSKVSVDVKEKAWLDSTQYKNYSFVAFIGSPSRARMKTTRFSEMDLDRLRDFLNGGGVFLLHRSSRELFATSHGKKFLATMTTISPNSKLKKLQNMPVGKGQFIYLGWDVCAAQPRRDVNTVDQERIFAEQTGIVLNMVADLFPAVKK